MGASPAVPPALAVIVVPGGAGQRNKVGAEGELDKVGDREAVGEVDWPAQSARCENSTYNFMALKLSATRPLRRETRRGDEGDDTS